MDSCRICHLFVPYTFEVVNFKSYLLPSQNCKWFAFRYLMSTHHPSTLEKWHLAESMVSSNLTFVRTWTFVSVALNAPSGVFHGQCLSVQYAVVCHSLVSTSKLAMKKVITGCLCVIRRGWTFKQEKWPVMKSNFENSNLQLTMTVMMLLWWNIDIK